MKGGAEPTVTDANVVLGYLPSTSKLGGDMKIDRSLAETAVKKVADALDMPLKKAAEGIINIVNENMFGALRLVSVEQGFDPRDFALVAFGGAGPLHANALGKLMGSWPVIVPPGPGVLCAYGDATTRLRDEASRTFIRRFADTADREVGSMLEELAETAARALDAEGVPRSDQSVLYQIDMRYKGQGMQLTVDFAPEDFRATGLRQVAARFDEIHTQLFTFALEAPHELVNLRAIVQGRETVVKPEPVPRGTADASAAIVEHTTVYIGGADLAAGIYDRAKLKAGNRIAGPAVVVEMDATTLILPDHVGEVDAVGNILIRPAK
jgi:N-methylhydantoinase A